MDTATAAAIAAVAVAAVALSVALAQVLQQYFVTGSLLRLCDDTVYGMLPGRGRRIWKGSQFRFRVVYSLPQIRLERNFWPYEYDDKDALYSFPPFSDVPPWEGYHPRGIRRTIKLLSNLVRQVSRIFLYVFLIPRNIFRAFRRAFRYSVRSSFPRITEALNHTPGKTPLVLAKGVDEGRLVSDKKGMLQSRKRAVRIGRLDLFEPTGKRSGEASWASFTRIVQYSCNGSLRYEVIEGDADRCPSDLSVVPMQVSLRDIIVMAIMAGMKVSNADLETGSLSMVGSAGAITSSKHPILGSIIHFNPTNVDAFFGWQIRHGSIDRLWLGRMKNQVPIAGRLYDWRDRDHIETYDGPWMRESPQGLQIRKYPLSSLPQKTTTYAFTGADLISPTEHIKAPSLNQSTNLIPFSGDVVKKGSHGVHDGIWSLVLASENLLARSMSGSINDQTHVNPENSEGQDTNDAPPESSYSTRIKRWFTNVKALSSSKRLKSTEDSVAVVPAEAGEVPATTPGKAVSGYGSTRNLPQLSLPPLIRRDSQNKPNPSDTDRSTREQASSSSSASRLSLLQHPVRVDQPRVPAEVEDLDETSGRAQVKAHQAYVSDEVDGEQRAQMADRGRDLAATPDFTAAGPNHVQPHNRGERTPRLYITQYGEPDVSDSESEEARKARESQEQRDTERAHRDHARHERRRQRRKKNKNERGWFCWRWLSQMDAIPGYCATPWSQTYSMSHCIRIVSVVLEALSGLVENECLHYTSDERLWESALTWAENGHSTWPSYAINARGGVVVNGAYTSATFLGFADPIARIELFKDDRFGDLPAGEFWDMVRLAELMMLDSWLSICGRAPEIIDGKSSLLRNMPALIQYLLDDFDTDFKSIDRSANEGGLQLIKDVAASLMDCLNDEKLSEAEQIFTLGAMLRTAKAGVCVAVGPYTRAIEDILFHDIRVWLV